MESTSAEAVSAEPASQPSSGERLRGALPRAEGSCRPFIKWAGGKRQLLPELRRYVPAHFERYIEPFVGGGALFFELSSRLGSARTPRALLADVNERLIRTYQGVRDSVEDVITLLREFKHEEKFYYSVRERAIDSQSDAEVAAWLIYLNKIGFNGLYRVNRQNRFNVPFGRHKNPTICDEQTLRGCSRALSGVELQVARFEQAVEHAQPGDLVYFDPPYVPVSVTSSFTKYTWDGFDADAQVRLRDVALGLKQRGVHVLLSNSSASSVRELYSKDFKIAEVSATRLVNSKAARRGAITELVIY
ncbi:MAG: DNA adenine methylase [Deltaproteobacteria bacterium]